MFPNEESPKVLKQKEQIQSNNKTIQQIQKSFACLTSLIKKVS